RGGDAGHRRAVAVRVARVGVGVGVQEASAGDNPAGQVGVGRVNAGVEDGDLGAAGDGDRAVGLVPGDLGQRALLGVAGVVRVAGLLELDRRVGPLHAGVLGEGGEDLVARGGGYVDDAGAGLGEVARGLAASALHRVVHVGVA